MVFIPEDYVPAAVPEDGQYEGTDLDPNVLKSNTDAAIGKGHSDFYPF
jgi:hypothetical protein